jgi:pimeloyl-ACP methyl ester carboxylesterase
LINRSRGGSSVSTFVLIPGAGGVGWYWHRVVPLLTAGGHEAIPVDLPGADNSAGLTEYADIVTAAIGARTDVVLVAQSLGGFTAPLVAARCPVRTLVLVNAMIPVPGETPGAWWDDTGSGQARAEAAVAGGYSQDFDEVTYFLHDVPAEVLADEEGRPRPEADAVFSSVCEFDAWPVPVKVVAGRDDRFFPAAFQQATALDRVGVAADLLPGGHLIALSQPDALARYLLAV